MGCLRSSAENARRDFVVRFVASAQEDSQFFRTYVTARHAEGIETFARPFMTPDFQIVHHEQDAPDSFEYGIRFSNGAIAIVFIRETGGQIESASLAIDRRPDAGVFGGDPCADAKTQREINRCMREQRDKAEAELGRRLGKLKKTLPDLAAQFERAQEAWRRYRELECAANGAYYDGGSMQPGQVFGCQAWLTEERVREIGRMLDEQAH